MHLPMKNHCMCRITLRRYWMKRTPSYAGTFRDFLDLYYKSEGCRKGFKRVNFAAVTSNGLERTNCTSSVKYFRKSWSWKLSPGIKREADMQVGKSGQRPERVKTITAFM